MKVEITLEGIIADTNSAISKAICEFGYTDFNFNNIKSYDAKHKGVGCPNIVLLKVLESDTLFDNVYANTGINRFLEWLYKNKVDITIHSKYISANKNKRLEWIKNYVDYLNIPNIEIICDSKEEGVICINNSSISIDYEINYVAESRAETKYMISNTYNSIENNQKFKDYYEELIVLDSIEEIKGSLREIYSEVFNHD